MGLIPAVGQQRKGKQCQRDAFIPFSAGCRDCTGVGFAMVDGPLILSRILRDFRVKITDEKPPVPVAHLTVRSKDGIRLRVVRR